MFNLQEALDYLKEYNGWRRYDGPIDKSPEMPNPTSIGIALDVIDQALSNKQTIISEYNKIRLDIAVKIYCAEVNSSKIYIKDYDAFMNSCIKVADEFIKRIVYGCNHCEEM